MQSQNSRLILNSLKPAQAKTKDEILGEFLHTCLYFLTSYDGDKNSIVKASWSARAYYHDTMLLTEEDIKEIQDIIINAMENCSICKIFDPNVENLREVEFLNEQGDTIRMDRLNIYPDGNIKVIEFKLKKPENKTIIETYISQLHDYVYIVKKVFNCNLTGAIIYFVQGLYEEYVFK